MAKVMVTGAAGFVGSHTVRALLEAGHTVLAFDNLSTGDEQRLRPGHPNLSFIKGDVTEFAAVKAVMAGCDHVIHLAMTGNGARSLEYPQETFRNNVLGFQNVLDAAREGGMMGWLVFASSAAVYGLVEKPAVAEEDSAGVVPIHPLAAANMQNEIQARLYREAYGVRTVGMRLFNVYGPGQDGSAKDAPLLARVVHSIATGDLLTIYGDGTQTRDFVFVADAAAALRRVLDYAPSADVPPVINVGCGLATSLLDAIRTVVVLKQVNPRVEYRPRRGRDTKHSCADISRLRMLMGNGWEPQKLSVALRGWLVK